jgi:hypothetical protein
MYVGQWKDSVFPKTAPVRRALRECKSFMSPVLGHYWLSEFMPELSGYMQHELPF